MFNIGVEIAFRIYKALMSTCSFSKIEASDIQFYLCELFREAEDWGPGKPQDLAPHELFTYSSEGEAFSLKRGGNDTKFSHHVLWQLNYSSKEEEDSLCGKQLWRVDKFLWPNFLLTPFLPCSPPSWLVVVVGQCPCSPHQCITVAHCPGVLPIPCVASS